MFQVELAIEPGQSLGLMIRGGVEYGLGVFVTGVDPGSVAERCGLVVSVQTVFFVAKIHFVPAPIFPRVNISKKGAFPARYYEEFPFLVARQPLKIATAAFFPFAWSRDGEWREKIGNRRQRGIVRALVISLLSRCCKSDPSPANNGAARAHNGPCTLFQLQLLSPISLLRCAPSVCELANKTSRWCFWLKRDGNCKYFLHCYQLYNNLCSYQCSQFNAHVKNIIFHGFYNRKIKFCKSSNISKLFGWFLRSNHE